MPLRLPTLEEFERAAKSVEQERGFRVRLMYLERGDERRLVFTRGFSSRPTSFAEQEAQRRTANEHTEEPEWELAFPELDALARQIRERVPDTQRVFDCLLSLAEASWDLRYGPYLAFGCSGEDLRQVCAEVEEQLASTDSWPSAEEIGQRIEFL